MKHETEVVKSDGIIPCLGDKHKNLRVLQEIYQMMQQEQYVYAGKYDVVKFACTRPPAPSSASTTTTPANSGVDVLECIKASTDIFTRKKGCLVAAAAWGNLVVYEPTEWAMIGAGKNGHLDMARYLHNNRDVKPGIYYASNSGHLHVVRYLLPYVTKESRKASKIPVHTGKSTFSRASRARRKTFSRFLLVKPQSHRLILDRYTSFVQNGHFYSTKSTENKQNSNVQEAFHNMNDAINTAQENGITDQITTTDSLLQTTGDAPWIGIQAAQTLIELMHTELGLPWWAALAGSGLAARGALFPLYIYQMKAAQRLVTAQKDFKKLWSAFRYARTFIPRSDMKSQMDAVLLARKGSKIVMKKHNARPIQTVLGSFIHIPLFILMAYGARDMIRCGNYEGMDVGGFWIWSNLLEADETYLLPFLATASTYLNLELSLRNRSDMWTWLGRKVQFLPILGFPIYASLPQGVFFYWLASSWFSLGQNLVLRNTRFRKALGLRPRPTQAPLNTSTPAVASSTSSSSSSSSSSAAVHSATKTHTTST